MAEGQPSPGTLLPLALVLLLARALPVALAADSARPNILFIIFDLEAAFLFPWAVSLDLTGWTGWVTMMTFLAELVIGLAYAWKMGALDWE